MDYFKVEDYREKAVKEIKGNIVAEIIITLMLGGFFIPLILILIYKGMPWTKIAMVFVTVLALFAVRKSIKAVKEVMGEKDDDLRGYRLSKIEMLDRKKKMNRILKDFDKSNKYRQYLRVKGIDDVEFIGEMKDLRDRIGVLEGYVPKRILEDAYNMILRAIIDPAFYKKDKEKLEEIKNSIEIIEEFKRIEDLKEKEEYILGTEGVGIVELIKSLGVKVRGVKVGLYVSVVKDLGVEKINSFIEDVNRV